MWKWLSHLTLPPLLGEDVTNQSLLEDFLFHQEVPETPDREGRSVLSSEKKMK